MSLAYDRVVEEAIVACDEAEGFAEIPVAVLVRTTSGRIRLALQGGAADLPGRLNRHLEERLGKWFEGPVIHRDYGPTGLRQVAAHLLDKTSREVEERGWQAAWPLGWPREIDLPGQRPRPLEPKWRAVQVTLGKEPWLPAGRRPGSPPWPLRAGTPRITAFYGFKGGVGRSTCVGIVAYQLARAGKRVVCVDLDLEAPGLTRLLLPSELPRDRGFVLDELLTAAATDQGLDELPLLPVEIQGVTLGMAPAGALVPTYIEKLARLDTLHRGEEESPVHRALAALLRRIREASNPDHIFLDCRSGLHDLAGLALHDLAHVDVLVGRGDAQELDGLQVLLPSLVGRRRSDDLRLLVVRTMLNPAPEIFAAQSQRHRESLYDLLSEHLYDRGEPPAPTDSGLIHDPCMVRHQQDLVFSPWLGEVDQALLLHSDYRGILERLEALWQLEPPAPGA